MKNQTVRRVAPDQAERFSPLPSRGLTADQVRRRVADGLVNVVSASQGKSYARILRDNLLTLFNLLNFALAACVILVGSYTNALFIGVIICNIIIGTYQEIRAKRTIEKLKVVSAPTARAVRDGVETELAVEQLVLDDISTGASNDIERATKIVRAMVMKYGMSDQLGPITYGTDDSNPFLGKEMGHVSNYSERTAAEIDEEIQSIISTAYQKTEQILRDHIDELHRLAGVLYEKEKIDGVEFQQVMDGNLLPSGMTAQALGQEPQEALPETGADHAGDVSLEETPDAPEQE